MTWPQFSFFLGVDQTGAALEQGLRARPLDCAFACEISANHWKVVTQNAAAKPMKLASLSREGVSLFLKEYGAPRSSSCAFIVDCVFGLSEDLDYGLDPWRTIVRTRGHSLFGRNPAEAFFDSLLKKCARPDTSELPRRQCERFAKANSVFQKRPFQKNIQTGTYRLWKDLAGQADEDPWLNFWPFDCESPKSFAFPWIFEAFPTFFWRELFNCRVRSPALLPELLNSAISEEGLSITLDNTDRIAENPDLADAVILAVSGVILQKRGLLFEPWIGFLGDPSRPRAEGWIAGVPKPIQ